MKRSFFVMALLVVCFYGKGQLAPVDSGSKVHFRIKNLGFNVTGSFRGLQGTVHFDPALPDAASFHVSVDANTVNTGIDMRDDHLRTRDYLDVQTYPRIVFASDRISATRKPGTFFATGKLTIKNVTRSISFPFTAAAQEGGYLFTGEFRINRKDFGVGGGSAIADNLTVLLSVFARKP